MAIKVGDKIPDAELRVMGEKGPMAIRAADLFKGKKVALFALPGAFTPTCSAKHLPGFVENADAIKKKGFDSIVCLSVNDAFVMDAWGKAQKTGDKVKMVADGNGDFTKAMGLELDLRQNGLGMRSQRFSMIVDDGKVTRLNIDKQGTFDVSSAEVLLKQA
jgi:peroxiredoxin